jgi:hypothetical protein
MNDDDILDYIEDSRNLRALGTELEFAYDENDMLILKQYVEPTRLQGITEGLQRVAGTTASIGAGAVGATLGFPTDLASLFVSIGKSVGAEDGKKLETFTNTFETLSKENYGSQFYKGLFDNFVDDLNISDQKKKDFKAGFVGGEFLGVGNVGREAAKKAPAVARNIRETSEEVGEAAQKRVDENRGSMTMSSMGVGEMSNMVDKGLSKLAPTQQIESLKIMTSDSFKIPTKQSKTKIDDIFEYYETKPKLDISNANDFKKMVDEGVEEIKYQLDQDVTGVGWYDKDVKDAMADLDLINPKFKNNPQSKDFVVFLTSILSPGYPVGFDFRAAIKVADNFLNTNDVPHINPETNRGFGRFAASREQLKFVNAIVKQRGLDGFLEFIHTPTTRREINAVREQLGFNKIAGALDKEIFGADAFGPKVSKFMQNLLGTSDENVPDIWFTRGFNRKRGTMFNVTQDGNRTGIQAPRTLKERELMDQYIVDVKSQLKSKYNIELNNRDTQAVLWYFEQGLYTKLGVASEPKSYRQITRTLLEGKTNDSQRSIPSSATTETQNPKATAESITTGEIPDG